jgi:hypothetical protein
MTATRCGGRRQARAHRNSEFAVGAAVTCRQLVVPGGGNALVAGLFW